MNLTISQTPIGFSAMFNVPEGMVYIDLSKVREHETYLVGILKITAVIQNNRYRIFLGYFNTTSSQSRNATAKHIKSVVANSLLSNIQWEGVLEKFATEVYNLYYSPKKAQMLQKREFTANKYLLYPLIPQSVPTLFYAPGGAGKSLLALYLTLLVHNGFDLYGSKTTPANALYVDWEMDFELMSDRFSQIISEDVQDVELKPPFYYQAQHALRDELEDILTNVEENNIKFIILDSAAMAISGDIVDAAAVIDFFQNIRKITSLGISVAIITHISKAHKEKDDGVMPVGSVFFENLARMTWEVKAIFMPNNLNVMQICLYNRKSNFGYHEPIGFQVTWESGNAFIKRVELDDNVKTGNSLQDMILSLLKDRQSLSISELAELTGVSKNSLSVTLNRLSQKGWVRNSARGEWEIIK